MCELTRSPYESLALNALWALKNLTFHALDGMKAQVMTVFGYNTLRTYVKLMKSADDRFIGPSTPLLLRVQAFEIIQNLFADAPSLELARYVDNIGEGYLLDVLSVVAREGIDPDLRVPVGLPAGLS